MNRQHLSVDELADAAEGLLDPERAAFAESHIAGCPDCQAQSEALREVTASLRAEPAPTMPQEVSHRLKDVIAAEGARRATRAPPRTGKVIAVSWPPEPGSHARRWAPSART
jgi:anti-sigma factor RsiW